MALNRPLEAAEAFDRALQSGSSTTRSEAAYGQALAHLRRGLTNDAAIAAAKAPLSAKRADELSTAILAQRASATFDAGRYVETLLALDQRATIAPEQNDLMMLRGYSYMHLRRYDDALRVFQAVSATGSRAALRGVAEVIEVRNAESRRPGTSTEVPDD